MRSLTNRSISTVLLLVVLCLVSREIHAQRPDRAGDVRQRGPTATAASAGAQALIAGMPMEPPKPRYSFEIHPQGVWDNAEQQIGAALAFTNDSLLVKLPFGLTLRDRLLVIDSERHNLFQVDTWVQPLPTWDVGLTDLTMLVSGLVRHRSRIDRLAELALELNAPVFTDTIRRTGLVAILFGYYDHLTPHDAPSSAGLTLGVGTQLNVKFLRLDVEYDLDSEYAGEDYFLATLAAKVRQWTPYFTAEKHGTYRIGIKLNVPEDRGERLGTRR